MSVGEWILRERTARGWSQFELGTKSGMDPRQIGRYERGEIRPVVGNLQKIAAAFGIALPWQVVDSDDEAMGRYLAV